MIAELATSPAQLPLSHPLRTKLLSCLLVQVRDDAPDDVRGGIGRAVAVYLDNEGTILDMMASIQLVAFGGPFFTPNMPLEESSHQSRTASAQLLAALGDDVRIVAFIGEMAIGAIGSDKRIGLTILPPRFDRYLAALLTTEYGRVTVFTT